MMKSTSKHIAMRTCAACGEVKPKRELVRLVCLESGWVEVDIDGKKNGRGAYLCPSGECWEKGLKHGQLDRVLRMTITPDNKVQLLEQGNNY
jgi:predicted RNA-binding protein YlxR (DUF448 family)